MPHIPKTLTPILLVEQTIEYKVYQHYTSSLPSLLRLPLHLDIIKLKYWEKYYWKKADLVATVSEFDKNEIKSLKPYKIENLGISRTFQIIKLFLHFQSFLNCFFIAVTLVIDSFTD